MDLYGWKDVSNYFMSTDILNTFFCKNVAQGWVTTLIRVKTKYVYAWTTMLLTFHHFKGRQY